MKIFEVELQITIYTLSLEAGIARPSARKMMWSADRPKTKQTSILRWKQYDFETSKPIFSIDWNSESHF